MTKRKALLPDMPPLELSEPIPAEEVGYWRVSTGRDQNPDMQIAALKKRGIPDDNIFGDEKSGRRFDDRPQLDLALKLMYGRPGWTLVVWKLDRLGRNAEELLKLIRELTEAGQFLISITEALDTRTPMGKAFIGMLAVFAQLESDTTAERSKAGMLRARERGSQVGRKTKFTKTQFEQMEKLILAKRGKPLSLNRIARRFRCSVAAVNFHFPGWRSKTAAQRKEWRRTHPLPTK